MPTIKRILCPLDFTRFSRHALQQAVAPIAATVGIGSPIVLEPARLGDAERAALEAELRDFVADVDAEAAPLRTTLLEGDPVAAVVRRAIAWPADLIVMGTHGRSGFDRLMLGSVAERVLRRAPCPVLIVPPRSNEATSCVSFARIVCGVDFSPASLHALDYATALAAKGGPGVTALHAVELLADGGGMRDDLLFGLPEIREDLRRAALERLAAAIPDALRGRCPIFETVTSGKAWKQILRVAGEEQADLIVLGVTGRATADLLLFGSTTQQVLRQASCPVLTIHA